MPYLGNEVAPLVQALEGKELKLDSDGDSSITADTDDQIDFKTGGTDRLQIQSTAGNNVVIADGLTLTNGNIAFASGHGIDFSATANSSGSMSSELFEDYEEGTWTPTLPTGGSASAYHASYVKVGKMVFAHTYCAFSSIPNDNQRFQIGGLPYASLNTSSYYGGGMLGYSGSFNTNHFLQPLVSTGNTYAYFHRNDGNSNDIKNSDVDGATRYFIITAVYRTD